MQLDGREAAKVLERIRLALVRADEVLKDYTPGAIDARKKAGGDPVTEADLAVDKAMRETLLEPGDGWLSEETADEPSRLSCRRVWVVDPIDGTREFVSGIPEWCVSIGLVEDGEPVAGGQLNRSAGHLVLGAVGYGVTLNGVAARATTRDSLSGATVLASRTEAGRGEWKRFDGEPFTVRPMGSVAYKLGLVGAGLADATWTLVPKHEWDVAAGVALIRAGGGDARLLDGRRPQFNQPKPKLTGLIAAGPRLIGPILRYLQIPS